jgi:hypothetical protein
MCIINRSVFTLSAASSLHTWRQSDTDDNRKTNSDANCQPNKYGKPDTDSNAHVNLIADRYRGTSFLCRKDRHYSRRFRPRRRYRYYGPCLRPLPA